MCCHKLNWLNGVWHMSLMQVFSWPGTYISCFRFFSFFYLYNYFTAIMWTTHFALCTHSLHFPLAIVYNYAVISNNVPIYLYTLYGEIILTCEILYMQTGNKKPRTMTKYKDIVIFLFLNMIIYCCLYKKKVIISQYIIHWQVLLIRKKIMLNKW